jgi:hypothetical protein
MLGIGLYLAYLSLQLAVIVRALLRPNREPSSRIAWVVVIAVVPGIGIIAYLLLGETNIGRRRVSTAWLPTWMLHKSTSTSCSTSGCRTTTAARLSRR